MKLNKLIDHTLLKPEATADQIVALCKEAKENDFKSVCVQPYWVELASKELTDTDVEVCTVIGFPLGANTTFTKVAEAKDAVATGATEIDMVINIGELKKGNWKQVGNDIEQVVQAVSDKIIVKVIIETCLLSEEEIAQVTEIVVNSGADFVKTSTGFSTGGATIPDVKIMNQVVKGRIGIKASGGVRTKEDALAMVEAGATRIGTSNGITIVSK